MDTDEVIDVEKLKKENTHEVANKNELDKTND